MEQQAANVFNPIVIFPVLTVTVFLFFCQWKIFVKAGKPGWAAIVPIYNFIIMLKIAGKPWWYIFLLFVPLAGILISFVMLIDFGRAFGKKTEFGMGLIFLPFIFIPILAFGDAQYIGPEDKSPDGMPSSPPPSSPPPSAPPPSGAPPNGPPPQG